jgi:hypothetical protein
MSDISLPSSASIPGPPMQPAELSPEALFDRAAVITGSYFRGDPHAAGASPEDMVMGAIATFSGDSNISSYERGVLLAQVAELKSDGVITPREASNFANEVEALRRGLVDYRP